MTCGYYLYILYSESSDKYYTGVSQNAFERLDQHNNSDHNTYTSKHRPWRLAALFCVGNTLQEAMKIEKFIKRQKSRSILKKLIEPSFMPADSLAQLVRVPHVRD